MGLFINSNLTSINMHKRLTELERRNEISVGLYALRDFIEKGGAPSNIQYTIDTLTRLLPTLPGIQQEYVIQELITPLLSQSREELDLPLEYEQELLDQVDLKLVPSDYETEFRMMLKRAGDHDLKNPNLLQYQHRKNAFDAKKDKLAEELKKKKDAEKREKVTVQMEQSWQKLNVQQYEIPKQKYLLKLFLFNYHSFDQELYPILQDAQSLLDQLNEDSP